MRGRGGMWEHPRCVGRAAPKPDEECLYRKKEEVLILTRERDLGEENQEKQQKLLLGARTLKQGGESERRPG